jgi:DNA recombination protein RmuC
MIAVVLAAALAAVLTGLAVAVYVTSRQREAAQAAADVAVERVATELRAQAGAEREAAVRAAVAQLDAVSRERTGAQVQAGRDALRHDQELIDQRLDEVRRDVSGQLQQVSDLVAALAASSQRSFGAVEARLRAHAETTESLAATTQSLREALANPKARGQWGERMAEDVLRLAGFVEHVNYEKQRAVEGGRTIPDYTFPLPKGHVLYMDVKFPLAQYLRFLDATTDAERAAHRDAFLRDVRLRVRELARREYHDPARGSLDYVLLFLPNESVSGFVHETDPSLIEDALRQKVVFCSPLTLFAMLGVVRQAYDNLMVEQTAHEMLAIIGSFQQQWVKYGDAVDLVGKRLESASRAFDDLNGTRRRQLERPLARLEDLRRRQGIAADPVDAGADVLALEREATA